ncbi:MAG: hypothetical protein ACI9SP_003276 [Arenicella sp.]|jgi:hypothetical protein
MSVKNTKKPERNAQGRFKKATIIIYEHYSLKPQQEDTYKVADEDHDDDQKVGGSDNREPDNGEPDHGEPDSGEPDNGKPDNGKSDNGKPDNGKPDNGKPDNGKSDNGKPDNGEPDNGKPDNGEPDNGEPCDGPRPVENSDLLTTDGKNESIETTTTLTKDELIWPKGLSAEHKTSIFQVGVGLKFDSMQELLDAIAGNSTPVRNPVAFFSGLVKKLKNGEYVASSSIAVKLKRQRALSGVDQREEMIRQSEAIRDALFAAHDNGKPK